jgi:putative hydrolase of HD superfamily
MKPPSMDRIAELQQMIADFASVERQIKLADKPRFENDADHSFGLAITCWFLAPKIAPNLDLGKILQYALAHDIVELHAGDTFIFDTERVKTKSAREDAAIEQLEEDWPDFQELTSATKNYKDHTDPEARFVYVVDKILPPVMVHLGEKGDFWQKNNISLDMHYNNKKSKMQISPEASVYFDLLHEWLDSQDYDFGDPTASAGKPT